MVNNLTNQQKRKIARKPWTEAETKILIKEYQKGKTRPELCDVLKRTSGSIANKIRLLVKDGLLDKKRGLK